MDSVSDARMVVHGVPRQYTKYTLDSFPGDPAALKVALDYLESFGDDSEALGKGHGLLFFGINGTGKTSLAVGILRCLLERNYLADFYRWPALIEARARSWRSEEAALDFRRHVRQTDLLVIDDLGKEFSGGRELSVSVLDDVVRGRTAAGKPTLITMNADPATIRTTYGDSIASLFNEFFEPVEVHGRDMRVES